MDVNDDAGCLTKRVAWTFFAGKHRSYRRSRFWPWPWPLLLLLLLFLICAVGWTPERGDAEPKRGTGRQVIKALGYLALFQVTRRKGGP